MYRWHDHNLHWSLNKRFLRRMTNIPPHQAFAGGSPTEGLPGRRTLTMLHSMSTGRISLSGSPAPGLLGRRTLTMLHSMSTGRISLSGSPAPGLLGHRTLTMLHSIWVLAVSHRVSSLRAAVSISWSDRGSERPSSHIRAKPAGPFHQHFIGHEVLGTSNSVALHWKGNHLLGTVLQNTWSLIYTHLVQWY